MTLPVLYQITEILYAEKSFNLKIETSDLRVVFIVGADVCFQMYHHQGLIFVLLWNQCLTSIDAEF